MANWNLLAEIEKHDILLRPQLADQKNIRDQTQSIINQVRSDGDHALVALTKKYDFVNLNALAVTSDEFATAAKNIDSNIFQAIQFAKTQIEKNQISQLPAIQTTTPCSGVFCERQPRPIERVGLYIPGGSAPLVSTVLMLAIPAKIAKCPLKILCTPPNAKGEINPYILVAAKLCGVEKIFKVGGAQAIAAMAYGTKLIPKVDKIFGPGNAWVTQAKILVSEDAAGASIDMPAGPSELMVIADDLADSNIVASDLLSQAEHSADSQVMLITFSEKFANTVQQTVMKQLEKLPRSSIAKKSLSHSRMIIANDVEQAILIANSYAPEHLILQIENSEKYIALIQNAGAVFIGPWTPETVGDYVTGSNHVLPTYGFAKSYSGLSVSDFMKYISFQKVTQEGLEKIGPYAEKLAEIEGLQAHKRAVSFRLKSEAGDE